MSENKKRQGRLSLVLLGSVAALAACQPANPYSTQVEQVTRAGYANKADCVEDWGREDDCEEERRSGGGFFYWGPYYSSAGRVYGYDGVTRSLTKLPSKASATQNFMASENQIYRSGSGKYASTPKASPSNKSSSFKSASVSRGGFGGGGRGGFSSGGG